MIRLSPRQIAGVAALIRGDNGLATRYRTAAEIDVFFRFVDAPIGSFGGSRPQLTQAVVEAANQAADEGRSGVSQALERILVGLLDRRESDSDTAQAAAVDSVNELLLGLPVKVNVGADRSVVVTSTTRSRQQRVLDEQIHTVFEVALTESDLHPARAHYEKARRYLTGTTPDYENAAKEAVSSVESLVKVLTGVDDYVRAVKRATSAGLIPRPIDEIAIKLYGYRGSEPGVAHGSADAPSVTEHEAHLVVNLAGSLGAFFAAALRSP